MINSFIFKSLLILAAVGAALWALPAASASTCLLNDSSKVCLDLSSVPATEVQPSGLTGTPTYVNYKLTLSNTSLKSTRFVELRMTLLPATGFTAITAPPVAQCSISGSQLLCNLDKITASEPVVVRVTANAPPYEGAQTATKLVGTAVFGWQGRTQTTTSEVAVNERAGATFVPPNTTVSLVTSPETTNQADQVTAADPLWVKMTIPPRPEGFFARLAIINDGPNFSALCVGGLFYPSTGGPHVCRDPGSPQRWIFTELPDGSFTPESPLQFTMMWDDTIVPPAQLPPSATLATGTPPFAIFHNQTEVGVPYGPTRAFSNVCDSMSPVAPCIHSVERLSNDDWVADFLKPTDGSDMSGGSLAALRSVMDYLLNVAYGGPITVGPIMR